MSMYRYEDTRKCKDILKDKNLNRDRIKKHILIMGEDRTTPQVKYLHGNYGKGTFTFLGFIHCFKLSSATLSS